ncbi:endonuclease/exonuclease/phosphatase family protein [Mangrovimonas spongiae]|uniref:Endonuclease/exonuclease/phosphatase family protein n=1 Tax=Mangrovimonas spongiae TaxID=2494697 RepID=A0A3R9MGP6_9FLAO|nr:endonuclease/exonuclease/phosphatase family protein [Mangrovimonas spongiae]RSK41724.1 endonuclease/exonuclease/phosphatase family protein [Mangrovimonas spongiae]
MRKLRLFTTAIITLLVFGLQAQNKKKYIAHTVAFYNLENLFDTENDPDKYDEASPIMEMNGDVEEVYKKKVVNMAKVLADIGKEVTHNSPAVIGVSEVENIHVLEDVVNDPQLVDKDYGIVHYNSPDERGIDVALIYQKALFTPLHTSSHELVLYDDNSTKRDYTRDQLLVSGKLDGEMIHVIVNHWPSRSGGEARSRPKRVAAAKLSKKLVDSLQNNDPYAKIFVMGDFNDNPTNDSLAKVLKANDEDKEDVAFKGIYNPYYSMFKKDGLGTTGYRDSWSLFDQILVSQPLLEKDFSSFRYYKAGIYNKSYLVSKHGRWKGYPKRSFSNGRFADGYSDHFPVYVYVLKEVKE